MDMTDLSDKLKERKRILQGVRKLKRVRGLINYDKTLEIIFEKKVDNGKV